MERRNKFYLLFSCIGEEFSRLGDHSRAIHFLELAMDCDDCTSEKVKFSLVGSLLRSFLALNEKGKAFFWAKSQLELAAKAEGFVFSKNLLFIVNK
jgi:hypothetical protein